jgi:hypothetical protein
MHMLTIATPNKFLLKKLNNITNDEFYVLILYKTYYLSRPKTRRRYMHGARLKTRPRLRVQDISRQDKRSRDYITAYKCTVIILYNYIQQINKE